MRSRFSRSVAERTVESRAFSWPLHRRKRSGSHWLGSNSNPDRQLDSSCRSLFAECLMKWRRWFEARCDQSAQVTGSAYITPESAQHR